MQVNDKKKQTQGMTRRKFVISLGAGVTSVIAGYFLVSESFSSSGNGEKESGGFVRPQLRKDVVFGNKEGLVTINRPDGEEPVLYAVNDLGAEILRRLDGNHTVEDIGGVLAAMVKNCRKEEMNAKIALFVAQTAMLGFLSKPFYARLYETYDA